jgi:hypothetical protein
MYQQMAPRLPPTRAATPSAVMPAITHWLATVPLGKNSTDSIVGSASPIAEAGSQMTA